MNWVFGKVFKSEIGVEYGVIWKVKELFFEVLFILNVFVEDDCGNYFVLFNEVVCFWDYEIGENYFFFGLVNDFVFRCFVLEEVELEFG